MTRLKLLDFACRALRLTDTPRGRLQRRGRYYRFTLRLLERRYQAALVFGRDFARPYDYVPF